MAELISIIVPVYNAEKYIDNCICATTVVVDTEKSFYVLDVKERKIK